jgi:subtilisin
MRCNFKYLVRQMANIQKYRIFLYLNIILIIMSGIASAADHNMIVGFKKPVGQDEDNLILSHGGTPKKNFHAIYAVSSRVPDNKIAEIKSDPRVAYVEYEQTYKASDEYTSSWGVQHIGSQSAHNQSINGTGVKVAILDTGIDYNHADLKDNYKGGYNIVSNNTNPMDDNTGLLINSHGTRMAGIIGAEKNDFGVVGVAPNTSLYAVKVLDGSGFGNTSWLISGIQWAIDNKMNVVSISIEGPFSQALQDACDAAYNSGILLVATAGNTYGGNVTYPAGYNSVIAVTATDFADRKAIFSPIDPKIELSAPGVNINSTTIGGGYGIDSGTSMAAPHVTGVAALIYSTNFSDVDGDGVRDNKDVRIILQNSAKDLGNPGKDDTYGYGLVDIQAAVLGITVVKPVLTKITVSPSIATLNVNGTQLFNATALDQNNTPMAGINISWTISNSTVGNIYRLNEVTDTTGNVTTTFTAEAVGNATVNATNGSTTGSANVIVVAMQPGNISGFKINDTNGNGIWDSREMGIENWTIRLIGITGKGKNAKVIRKETFTDGTGFYKFDNLSGGRYFVIEKLKKGFVATNPPVKRIKLAQGKNSMNNNFTNRPVNSEDNPDSQRDIDDYELINRDIDSQNQTFGPLYFIEQT